MSRHPVVFLLCFLVLLLARPPALQCRQLVIDSDAQFRFALAHMEKHRYDLAVVELERFIYFFPEDRRIPRAHYLVGACYVAQKKYETARKVLAHVHEAFPGTEAGGRALLLMGVSYERQGALGEAERCFNRVLREYPRAPLKDAARYRLGWTRMKAGRWKEASDTFREIPPESGLHAGAGLLAEKSLEGESLPLKDPAAAGVMAGILPGMGHAYCGRPRDGLVALLVNGLFTWAAAESFHRDQDVLGGILAFLELGWYSGNIYSAVNCAHKYNRKVADDYRKRLPDDMNINVFSSGDARVGLALKVRF